VKESRRLSVSGASRASQLINCPPLLQLRDKSPMNFREKSSARCATRDKRRQIIVATRRARVRAADFPGARRGRGGRELHALQALSSGLRARSVIYQESCRREAAATVRACSVSGLATSEFITGRSAQPLPAYAAPAGVVPRGKRDAPPPPPPPPPPFPAERAIPPTIGAANTFPGTRVMILLYYANYAVAAHGQWCILMAIVAQRGAIAIDQSCSGYANSRAQPGEHGARRATRRWRGGEGEGGG